MKNVRAPAWAGALVAVTMSVPVAPAYAACTKVADTDFFTSEWIMSSMCNAVTDSPNKLAVGALTSLGKNLAGKALDSYIPGASALLGLGGDDPFAAHVERIIDEIKRAESHIVGEVDAAWLEAREYGNLQLNATFDGTLATLTAWNANSHQARFETPDMLIGAVADMREVVSASGSMLGFAGQSSETVPPYPWVGNLHSYAMMVQALLEYESEEAHWLEMRGTGMSWQELEGLFEEESSEERNEIDQRVRDNARQRVQAVLADAFGTANRLATQNPFRTVANWSVRAWRHASEAHCTRHAGIKAYVEANGLESQVTPYSYGVMLKRRDAQGVERIAEERVCMFWVYDPGFTGGHYVAAFDGLAKRYATHLEIMEAHRQALYHSALLKGYAPFRIMLDRWHELLRYEGVATGTRPRLSLDADLEAFLLDGPSAAYKADYANFVAATTPAPTLGERSLIVSYGLEQGAPALTTMAWGALEFDPLGGGSYPLAAHLAFMRSDARGVSRQAPYYRGQFASKFVSISP